MAVLVATPDAYSTFHFDGDNLSELQTWANNYKVGQFDLVQVGTAKVLFCHVTVGYPGETEIRKSWEFDPDWGLTIAVKLRLEQLPPIQLPDGTWEPGGYGWQFSRFVETDELPVLRFTYDEVYQPIENLN